MFELYLSTDGKHTVHVSVDKIEDEATMMKVYENAKKVYQRLVEDFGTKQAQAVKEYSKNGKEEIPVCAFHKKPMTKVIGQYGEFWTCRNKMDDGTWCPYKPPKK